MKQHDPSDSYPLGKLLLGYCLCAAVLLYNGVLLVQQVPDLKVVITQAAFQSNASSLRLDSKQKDAEGHHQSVQQGS